MKKKVIKFLKDLPKAISVKIFEKAGKVEVVGREELPKDYLHS